MVKACFFCKANNDSSALFCNVCNTILPYAETNSFALLDLPCTFQIDKNELETNYFNKLSLVHPDKFIQSSQPEKEIAQENASALTAAYECLKSNYPRALELLKVNGYDVNAKINLDSNFLAETIEWREELLEADDTQAKALLVRMHNSLKQHWQSIDELFASQHLSDASLLLAKIKFVIRFIEEIEERIYGSS